MIGNDVVDYTINEKKYENQRFINRTLSLLEKKYLHQSNNKQAFFWCLWAAKEAAYKACQRLEAQCVFSPPLFTLTQSSLTALLAHDFNQKITGEITFINKTLWFEFNHLSEHVIHCVAAVQPYLLNQIQSAATKSPCAKNYLTQSSEVRQLAFKLLQQNGINAHIKRPKVKIKNRTKPGPPVLFDAQTQKPRPEIISLSHDNHWLAVALLPN